MKSLSPRRKTMIRSNLMALILSLTYSSVSAQNLALPRTGSGARAQTGTAGVNTRVNSRVGSFTTPGLTSPINLKTAIKPVVSLEMSQPTENGVPVLPGLNSTVAGIETLAAPLAIPQSEGLPQGQNHVERDPITGYTPMDVLHTAAQTKSEEGWRIPGIFDGMTRRKTLVETDPALVVAADSRGANASGLMKSTHEEKPQAEIAAPMTPAQPKPSRGLSRAAIAVLTAALVMAVPAFALAAPAATAVVGVSYLAMIHPLATAAAAIVGAVYGIYSTHQQTGKAPSAGEVIAAVLRYGIIGGAGAYVLLDLTQVLFLGLSPIGINPLPASMATAALAHGAFQGKFTEAATTPSDRLMTTFPAIAAALGLNLGIFLTGAALPIMLAASAMSLTGVAAAVYGALYEPGKSASAGPASMTRGFVLQSLMTGLALSVANPLLAAPFALLAAWGFWDVMSTAVGESWRRLVNSARRD